MFFWKKLLLVVICGGAGSALRYLLQGWIQRLSPRFPLGTMLVNLSGCFAMGVLATLFTGPLPIREEYRIGILVGILGGYTTFSSFSLETNNLARDREFLLGSVYLLVSVAVGLCATWLGRVIVNRLYGITT